MRSYHVILADGSERDIRAEEIAVADSGSLLFLNGSEVIIAYGPGSWKMVEVERKDDKV
jgi:hypothetical protein